MYDHVKSTLRDVNPKNNIILHVTNDLNLEKTSSQIARSIIDLAVSLKTNTNNITIFLITPRTDHLNNKASRVNNCLVNTCSERHICHCKYMLRKAYMCHCKYMLRKTYKSVIVNICSKTHISVIVNICSERHISVIVNICSERHISVIVSTCSERHISVTVNICSERHICHWNLLTKLFTQILI